MSIVIDFIDNDDNPGETQTAQVEADHILEGIIEFYGRYPKPPTALNFLVTRVENTRQPQEPK